MIIFVFVLGEFLRTDLLGYVRSKSVNVEHELKLEYAHFMKFACVFWVSRRL
jgi:hypothetical protein